MTDCVELRKQLNLDILNDWVQVGTMLLVSRFLTVQDSGAQFADRRWMEQALFTLLGFTAYHLVTRQVSPLSHPNMIVQSVIDDWLKVGTMLVVSRLLAGGSVTDQRWLQSSLYTLLGFTAFDVVTHKFVPQTERYQGVMQDTFKHGTMMVVSQLLAGGSLEDQQWQRGSLYTLIGFAAYRLVTKHLVTNIVKTVYTTGVNVATTAVDYAGDALEDVIDATSGVRQNVVGMVQDVVCDDDEAAAPVAEEEVEMEQEAVEGFSQSAYSSF